MTESPGDSDPPFDDEPHGHLIGAIGIIIPLLVQSGAQRDDKREA